LICLPAVGVVGGGAPIVNRAAPPPPPLGVAGAPNVNDDPFVAGVMGEAGWLLPNVNGLLAGAVALLGAEEPNVNPLPLVLVCNGAGAANGLAGADPALEPLLPKTFGGARPLLVAVPLLVALPLPPAPPKPNGALVVAFVCGAGDPNVNDPDEAGLIGSDF
jgi:hypothetical protein